MSYPRSCRRRRLTQAVPGARLWTSPAFPGKPGRSRRSFLWINRHPRPQAPVSGGGGARCSWRRGGSHVSSLPWSAPLQSRAEWKTSRRRERAAPRVSQASVAPVCRSCATPGSLREAFRGNTSAIRDLKEDWLGWQDSNLRYTVPKTAALPLGYTPTVECVLAKRFAGRNPFLTGWGALRGSEHSRLGGIGVAAWQHWRTGCVT